MRLPKLFIHGGPGMNSYAEHEILGPLFREVGSPIEFWNEPSLLRPNGDLFQPGDEFFRAAGSVERKLLRLAASGSQVHLVAHSFGAHYAVLMARRHPEKLASVALLTPALEVYEAFKNVMRLAQRDFEKNQPEKAFILREHLGRTMRFGDENFFQGMSSALEDPDLLSHYWAKKESLEGWAKILGKSSESGFDFDSFLGTLKSFNFFHLNGPLLELPRVQVVFAELDPIVNQELETKIVRSIFENAEITVVPRLSHFAHLESPAEFTQKILKAQSDHDNLIDHSQTSPQENFIPQIF